MKIQCDACENAVAAVMCCADEAALCVDCDNRVHAANRLANKHQRVPLLPQPKEGSKCDICQEGAAFFFCLEDRALLCRDCDISIHTANDLARKHTRFLLIGVRVGLENLGVDETAEVPSTSAPSPLKAHPSPFPAKPTSPVARVPVYQPAETKPSKKKSVASLPSSPGLDPFGGGSGMSGGFSGAFSGGASAGLNSRGVGASSSGLRRGQSVNVNDLPDSTVPVWSVDEILGIPNLADGYSLNDIGSTKGMDALMGDFDWTADLGMFDDLAFAESMHEVPNFDYSPTPGLVPTHSPSISKKGGSALKGKARVSYDMGPAVVPDSDDLFVVPDLGLQVPPPKRKRSNLDWH